MCKPMEGFSTNVSRRTISVDHCSLPLVVLQLHEQGTLGIEVLCDATKGLHLVFQDICEDGNIKVHIITPATTGGLASVALFTEWADLMLLGTCKQLKASLTAVQTIAGAAFDSKRIQCKSENSVQCSTECRCKWSPVVQYMFTGGAACYSDMGGGGGGGGWGGLLTCPHAGLKLCTPRHKQQHPCRPVLP